MISDVMSFDVTRQSWSWYLEVRAGHTFGKLSEEWLLDFDELRWLNNVQDLLQLIQEHHLLRTVSLWPELQQTHDHLRVTPTSKSDPTHI